MFVELNAESVIVKTRLARTIKNVPPNLTFKQFHLFSSHDFQEYHPFIYHTTLAISITILKCYMWALSDLLVKKMRAKRDQKSTPENRRKPTFPLPKSILLFLRIHQFSLFG